MSRFISKLKIKRLYFSSNDQTERCFCNVLYFVLTLTQTTDHHHPTKPSTYKDFIPLAIRWQTINKASK